jgi:hypothetical protein
VRKAGIHRNKGKIRSSQQWLGLTTQFLDLIQGDSRDSLAIRRRRAIRLRISEINFATNSQPKCTEMSRIFFTELATKDHVVYIHFTDIFSILSTDWELDKKGFRRIMAFDIQSTA